MSILTVAAGHTGMLTERAGSHSPVANRRRARIVLPAARWKARWPRQCAFQTNGVV